MGILNCTPDSFSDGGDHLDAAKAIAIGRAMITAGAALLDIGGESTRPGSAPTSPDEEQSRVLPVIRALAEEGAIVSVDTRHASTMEAALDAGAAIVNDVTGLAHDPQAAPLLARRGCPVILMHMRGTPATMNRLAQYGDLAAEVADELAARIAHATAAGVSIDQIAVDPGIGFAKLGDQNMKLLQWLPELGSRLGRPIVVGVSRKRFIGELTGLAEPRARDAGSIAAGLFALSRGASILRVHDVPGTVQAVRVWQALAG